MTWGASDMRELLEKLELTMRHQLEEVRAKFQHSGNKGATAEAIVRSVLRDYMPRAYGVGHGEIIDSKGRRSAQTDIVIVTGEHPFTFTTEDPGLFLVEGVFALGEVKSVLTSQELERTITNALKFRELKCDPIGMTMLHTMNDSDHKRFVGNPPYFLFAFESQIATETIRQRLIAQNNRSLDAVYILNQGVLLDCGDGQGSTQLVGTNGAKLTGWNPVQDSQRPLACLLFWLSGIPEVHHGNNIMTKYLLEALRPLSADSIAAPK